MPTDLEQQLARFAEALDRDAPTISLDDMLWRGPVAVDVDLPERPSSDRASHVNGASWIDTTPSHAEIGEGDVLIELGPSVAAGRPAWRRVSLKVALAVAAVALLVVTLAAIERDGGELDPADVPPSTVPTPALTPHTSPDGEVTVSMPETWDEYWYDGPRPDGIADDVWFGMLYRSPRSYSSGEEGIGLVDPVAYDAWCAEELEGLSPEERTQAGSPLLSAPADAATIAQQLMADPNFETTAPVATRVGGLDAVSIDVALALGGEPCGIQMIEIARWIHWLEPGLRLRLYLVDLPESMSVQTLAITVLVVRRALRGVHRRDRADHPVDRVPPRVMADRCLQSPASRATVVVAIATAPSTSSSRSRRSSWAWKLAASRPPSASGRYWWRMRSSHHSITASSAGASGRDANTIVASVGSCSAARRSSSAVAAGSATVTREKSSTMMSEVSSCSVSARSTRSAAATKSSPCSSTMAAR